MKIAVKFCNQPAIEIAVDDTETGRLYFDLCKQQLAQEQPFFRDTAGYTPEYMLELAQQAQAAFGWNWLSADYDTSVTAQLHKDLENSVGQLGFDQIPEQHDQLLYELHHCLHAIQFGKQQTSRTDNLQIEWFTDNSLPLPADFEFKQAVQLGDLILINPYVGHNPLQIYMENDFSSLSTTARFHDIIKPGIVLTTGADFFAKDTILKEFVKQDPAFVELHGQDKIKYYSGYATIGHTIDTAALTQVLEAKDTLVLDSVEFYD